MFTFWRVNVLICNVIFVIAFDYLVLLSSGIGVRIDVFPKLTCAKSFVIPYYDYLQVKISKCDPAIAFYGSTESY